MKNLHSIDEKGLNAMCLSYHLERLVCPAIFIEPIIAPEHNKVLFSYPILWGLGPATYMYGVIHS